MSLATLKKRTKTTYRRLSGISSVGGFNINRTSPGNYGQHFNAVAYGGGFSINGPHRNIGRVGQNMAMSKTHQTQKTVFIPGTGPGTGLHSFIKGSGGNSGAFYSNKGSTNLCCDLPLYSHPSVMSTHGLLTLKKEKFTHHNWVQPDNGHSDHSQSNYIENKIKPLVQLNRLPKCHKNKSCDTNTLHTCRYKRINNRLFHTDNIAKDLHTMNATEYMNYRKGRCAILPTKQYSQSWPPSLIGSGCQKRETYEEFLTRPKHDRSNPEICFDCNNTCN